MIEADAIVFVVDDDERMRQSLKNFLCSVGLRVEVFASAQEFLPSKLPDVPGCLLLDNHQARGDGYGTGDQSLDC